MRIIAGTHRGAPDRGAQGARDPADRRPRPRGRVQPDRAVDGARVLDLFAGSGALGLEALSRGAASVTFVESDRAACRTISENLEKLKLTGARSCAATPSRTVPQGVAQYDLILVDPPYEAWSELEPKLAQHLPASSRPTACSSSRPARAPNRRFRFQSAPHGGTVPRGSPSSSPPR